MERYLYNYSVKPYLTISTGHEGPITSISYSQRTNIIITASMDGSLKFWKVESPFSLTEVKKMYAQEASFLHVSLHKIVLSGNIPV